VGWKCDNGWNRGDAACNFGVWLCDAGWKDWKAGWIGAGLCGGGIPGLNPELNWKPSKLRSLRVNCLPSLGCGGVGSGVGDLSSGGCWSSGGASAPRENVWNE